MLSLVMENTFDVILSNPTNGFYLGRLNNVADVETVPVGLKTTMCKMWFKDSTGKVIARFWSDSINWKREL